MIRCWRVGSAERVPHSQPYIDRPWGIEGPEGLQVRGDALVTLLHYETSLPVVPTDLLGSRTDPGGDPPHTVLP